MAGNIAMEEYLASNPGFHLQHHTQAKRHVRDISVFRGKSLENHKFKGENLRLCLKKKCNIINLINLKYTLRRNRADAKYLGTLNVSPKII